MSRYEVGKDPYCYPGTTVLINKFNIRDQSILDTAEAEFSSAAIREIQFQKPPYTFDTWRKIHGNLFCSIYEWAGNQRTVGITKAPTVFCVPERIEPEAIKLFNSLENEDSLTGLDSEKFVSRVSYYFTELNFLHPFREGNGRSQRLLFDFICLHCGYLTDWSKVSPEDWVKANIHGAHINTELMEQAFSKVLSRVI